MKYPTDKAREALSPGQRKYAAGFRMSPYADRILLDFAPQEVEICCLNQATIEERYRRHGAKAKTVVPVRDGVLDFDHACTITPDMDISDSMAEANKSYREAVSSEIERAKAVVEKVESVIHHSEKLLTQTEEDEDVTIAIPLIRSDLRPMLLPDWRNILRIS